MIIFFMCVGWRGRGIKFTALLSERGGRLFLPLHLYGQVAEGGEITWH